jgi:hypothetical protein
MLSSPSQAPSGRLRTDSAPPTENAATDPGGRRDLAARSGGGPATIERWHLARTQSPAEIGPGDPPASAPRFSIAMLTDSTQPYPEVVHAMALAEALAACGHRVTLWAPGPPGVNEFHRRPEAGVTTRVVPVRPLGPTNRSAHLRSCIRQLRDSFDPAFFDVVHAHGWIGAAAVGPCLRTVHRLERPGAAELLDRHDRALRTATGHLCNSPAVAAELRTGWGIKAALVPDGVDAARFARAAAPGPAAVAARDRWRRDLGDYVLTVCDEPSGETTHDILSALAAPGADKLRVVIAHPPRTTSGRAGEDAWRRASASTGVPVVRPPALSSPRPRSTGRTPGCCRHWPPACPCCCTAQRSARPRCNR